MQLKNLKKTSALVALAGGLLLPLLSTAQDIHFSQLSQTPLLINPAQAGLGHDVSAILNYKDQWKSVTANPFRTFNMSADVAFMQKKSGSQMGAGIDFFSDKAGDGAMGTTTGQLHLSGAIAMNDNNLLSIGLFGGFGQRSITYDKLYWDNQYIGGSLDLNAPSMEPVGVPTRTYLDIGAGVAWFYGTGHKTISSNDGRTLTFGFAMHHLNQPVYSFYGDNDKKLPMKFVAHGSGEIGVKNYSLVLEPGYIVMIQGGHHEINAGMVVKYIMQEASHYTGRKKPAAVALGAYYRFGDAINLVTAYEMYPMRIGFSYDVNLSDLTAASKARGGFEISLRFMMIEGVANKKTSKFFN